MKKQPADRQSRAVALAAKSPVDARRGAQTVHRAIDILETFSIDHPSLSLAEISDAVNLTVPTTHRLLKALQNKEMVVWDSPARRYSLGVGVMRLAAVIIHRDDVVNIAEASMQRLRNQTGETVGLHWLVGQQRVCLVELTSPHPIRMASGVGQAYPLFAGAAGKAILAWLPVAEVGAVLADASRFPHMKAPTRDALLHDLAKIRKQGYAESAGETVAGAAAVATTILNSSGKPQGALNVTGPADRFNAQCRAQSRTPLLEAVDQIMRQLGRTNSVSR